MYEKYLLKLEEIGASPMTIIIFWPFVVGNST